MKVLTCILFSLFSFHAFTQIDSTEMNQELNEVVISFSKNINEFYSKRDHFIVDMVEDSTGIFVLLKNRGSYSLEKVNWNGSVSISQKLSFKCTMLTKDCLGNFYLKRTNEKGYQRFDTEQGFIHFGENFSDYSYTSEIEPCVANSHSLLVFKKLADHNQTIRLWTFDFGNDSVQEIYHYSDSTLVKTNNEEEQIIRNENFNNHARMGDIGVPELERLKDQQERKMFFHTVSTLAPYTPMFSYHQKHYFFNFLIDSVYGFDENLNLAFKTNIFTENQSQKKTEILLDTKNGQFYLIKLRNSSIEKFRIGDTQQFRTINSEGVHSRKKFIYDSRMFFLGKSSKEDNFNKILIEKL